MDLRPDRGSLGTSVAWQLVVFALLFAAISWGDITATVGDYVALGIGIGTILLSAGAYWLSRKRHAQWERFGMSLREEIRRNLSRVDYQLSRHGRWAALLMYAPMWMALVLSFWVFFVRPKSRRSARNLLRHGQQHLAGAKHGHKKQSPIAQLLRKLLRCGL